MKKLIPIIAVLVCAGCANLGYINYDPWNGTPMGLFGFTSKAYWEQRERLRDSHRRVRIRMELEQMSQEEVEAIISNAAAHKAPDSLPEHKLTVRMPSGTKGTLAEIREAHNSNIALKKYKQETGHRDRESPCGDPLPDH